MGAVYDCDYSVRREPEKGVYLLMLTRSRGVFRTEGMNMKMPAGTLIIYDGSCVQEYGADEGAFVCDWVSFDGEGDSEFIESLGLQFNRPIRFADEEFITVMLRNIAGEFYSLAARRVKLLDSLMRTLLVKLSDSSARGEESSVQTAEPHYGALMELREKIYRNPQLKWNVDTMAADVNMSRSYFQHIYREVFGVSCISDVISGKIEKAKEILSETSCTVSQVAAMCGYDNEEHFMRQFKKVVGVTPTRYRKNA